MWGDGTTGEFLDHWNLTCPYKPREEKHFEKGDYLIYVVCISILLVGLTAIWVSNKIWNKTILYLKLK